MMRVALVKQALDVFGPWSSTPWDGENPAGIFAVWPGKATLWELTCRLQADWFVISPAIRTDYVRDLYAKHPRLETIVSANVRNVVDEGSIPYDDYDLVISFDPVLNRRDVGRPVFAYYLNEHWDAKYRSSLQQPIAGYDIFLAHMMDASSAVKSLPQAVSFPYLYAPATARATFGGPKDGAAWVDWRTLTTLACSEVWGAQAERAGERLAAALGHDIRYHGEFATQPYGLTDPPRWGDAARYLDRLSRCTYYISVGRDSGAGQGLCDAASLGCICIGERDKVYHRLVCHPECLCGDMVDLPRVFGRITASKGLQQDALAWQDAALDTHFWKLPTQQLENAVALKRAGAVHQGSATA